MTNDKLQQIIATKNERLEHEAISRASQIIDEIAEHQQAINVSTTRIAKLRKELQELQVEQINPTSILG